MIKLKASLLVIFRCLIAIGLLLLIMDKIDRVMLWKALQKFDLMFAVFLILLNIVVLFLMAFRWKLLADQLSIKASFFIYLRAIWLAALSGQIGPSLIFSEVTRFSALQNYGQKKQLISSQILDRLSGQIVLLVLLFVMLPISLPVMADAFANHFLIRTMIVIIVLAAIIYAIFRYRKQHNLSQYLQIKLLNPMYSTTHYLISVFIQLLLMLCFLIAAMGLGRLQHPLLILSLLPFVLSSLMLLPISISDWGTRETAAVFFLSFSGLSPEDIVAISLIYGTAFSLTTLLGLFFLIVKRQ